MIYGLLAVYYTGLFLLFWPVVIPFRLFRRHQRKSLAVQKAQLEAMQVMLEQQKRLE
jgi:hypothetical protein